MELALSVRMTPSTDSKPPRALAERTRSLQILAKTLVRDLTAQGYETRDIVNLATQLLDQVTTHVNKSAPSARPPG